MPTLDTFDKKILSLLQQDNRISQRELAQQVNLSASAINRRIASMEKTGVIKNSVTLVDSVKVGRPITLIVEVSLSDERLTRINEAKKVFATCPQIQQIYYVTGEFDFVLIMNVCDMAEYEELTQRLFFQSGNVQRFRTMVSMHNVKQGLEVVL
ncbi:MULTISPECIES: Lrp/AsnC family transcriptional regulator [unclassified Lonepinella]|uniref:Lrp/AsnC family transcriptional regulator n=1 Tax=unclassified Lonepinella TaxID=2642006 RepID=UPI0036D76C05